MMGKKLQLYFNFVLDKQCTQKVNIDPSVTILQLKQNIIAGVPNIQCSNLLIKFKGQPLIDNMTLASYKVKDGDLIQVFLLSTKGPSFNFTGMLERVLINISKDAPNYRLADKGINFFAVCNNPACSAYKKQTIVPKGFGLFSIAQQMYQCLCPLCQTGTLPATNFGYYKARIKVKGKRKSQSKQTELPALEAKDNAFHTFKDGIQEWNFIKVVVEELV